MSADAVPEPMCYDQAMSSDRSMVRSPRRFSGESMLGPDGGYLWYCIPKNASRSISAMLSEAGASRIMDLYPGLAGDHFAQAGPAPRFTFAFVRNPYDRILSVWRNKIAPSEPNQNTEALYTRHPGLRAGMSFDAFIEWLGDSYPRGNINKHWAAQSDFVSDGAALLPDFIGRVEHFEEDVRRLGALVRDLGPIRRKNVSAKADGLSASMISPRSLDTIHAIYRQDFELLGYEESPT